MTIRDAPKLHCNLGAHKEVITDQATESHECILKASKGARIAVRHKFISKKTSVRQNTPPGHAQKQYKAL